MNDSDFFRLLHLLIYKKKLRNFYFKLLGFTIRICFIFILHYSKLRMAYNSTHIFTIDCSYYFIKWKLCLLRYVTFYINSAIRYSLAMCVTAHSPPLKSWHSISRPTTRRTSLSNVHTAKKAFVHFQRWEEFYMNWFLSSIFQKMSLTCSNSLRTLEITRVDLLIILFAYSV